ncbi:unnamed protein product [Owenia fusiformis]|uniref:Lengsin n=1 Tax=Owenia fusiformis TaxID=6347 RepID=A0A8J1TBA3_OWEFU|nr:unnamed protein product [Owenia fusiformis]
MFQIVVTAIMENIKQFVKDAEGCDFVRFTLADFNGIPRGKLTHIKNFERFCQDGLNMVIVSVGLGPSSEVPNIPKITELGFPDGPMIPQPGTFHKLPWAANGKYQVGEVLCEQNWQHDNSPTPVPRAIARQQIERLEKMGMKILSATEVEFQILEKDTLEPVFPGQDIFVQSTMAQFEELTFDIITNLKEVGIETENFHPEQAPGQMEIAMKPIFGLKQADNIFVMKQAIREICASKNLTATFMTTPYKSYPLHPNLHAFNGFHFNHSLWDIESGANKLYDATKPNGLSELGSYWIAGLLKHAPALCALQCPTVNCSRRIGQPWCPDKIIWSIGSRLVFTRVKKQGEPGLYLENRLPSAAANPYLVMASTIAAGIDGIINKMQLPIENDPNAASFPRTLEESLKALKEDKVMCSALGEEFVEWYTIAKTEMEVAVFKELDPTPEALEAERKMYLKFI